MVLAQNKSLSTLYSTLKIIDKPNMLVISTKTNYKGSNRINRYDEIIESASKDHKLDPALLKAVIKVESDFNPRAVSTAGAIGLCQLMPKTASMLKVDPWMVTENIEGGAKYLSMMLDKFDGNKHKSLWAYNAGPSAVVKNKVPKISKRYAKNVLHHYNKYKLD